MKKILFFILFVSYVPCLQAAPPADFGAGLMVGSMVSITGKNWFDQKSAVDFGLGFSGSNGTAIYADYLYHVAGIFGNSTRFGRETVGYIGGGVGIGFWDNSYECGRWGCGRRRDDSGTGVFLRGLVGFEWFPSTTRFGVFLELGPTFLLIPDTAGDLDIGLGARYYF